MNRSRIRKLPRNFSFRLCCLPFSLHSRHNLSPSLSLSRDRAVIIFRFAMTKIDRYFLPGKSLRTMQDNLDATRFLLELFVNIASKLDGNVRAREIFLQDTRSISHNQLNYNCTIIINYICANFFLLHI